MIHLSEGVDLEYRENISKAPIFVVGYYHSGTTLLKHIIAQDPETYSLKNESLFFHHLDVLRRQYPDLTNKSTLRKYITYLIKLASLGFAPANWNGDDYTVADFGITQEKFDAIVAVVEKSLPAAKGDQHVMTFRLVAENLMLFAGKQRWSDKSPMHVLYLQTILTEIEGSRVLEVVRDPRAVLASRKLRMQEEWHEKRERGGAIVNRDLNFDPILDSLRWRQMIRSGADARSKFPDRVLRVRYEDLVTQPEVVIPQLTEFLGMLYRPELLDVNVVNSTSWTGENKAKGIVKVAVDKWRKTLTQEELFVIQTMLRPEMEELGYEPSPLPFNVSTYVRVPLMVGQSAVRLGNRFRSRRRFKSDVAQ